MSHTSSSLEKLKSILSFSLFKILIKLSQVSLTTGILCAVLQIKKNYIDLALNNMYQYKV